MRLSSDFLASYLEGQPRSIISARDLEDMRNVGRGEGMVDVAPFGIPYMAGSSMAQRGCSEFDISRHITVPSGSIEIY